MAQDKGVSRGLALPTNERRPFEDSDRKAFRLQRINGVPFWTPIEKPFGYNESTEFLSRLQLKSPFGYNELTEFLSGLRVESLGLQMN